MEKILIVEDDAAISDLIKLNLDLAGYDSSMSGQLGIDVGIRDCIKNNAGKYARYFDGRQVFIEILDDTDNTVFGDFPETPGGARPELSGLDSGKRRDLITGEPVSGKIMKRADEPDYFKIFDMKNPDFDSGRSYVSEGRWTNVGTEQTSDGKTLSKLMTDTYQSYISDTTQANMQPIDFIDQATGLPVKEELYEDSTGQFNLFSYDTMEYGYVADDGSLFKVPDNALTPLQLPFQASGK